MPFFPHFFEYSSPLWIAQLAFTIWMLVDAHRRGVEFYWFWLILVFQPLGAWVYFILYKAKELRGGQGWLANLFHRPPSLQELRHRTERLPTIANRLELGERLVDAGEYAEALPHLEAVLARESEHCQALYALAEAHRGLGHPEQAVTPLQKLIARHSGWSDYKAWNALIHVRDICGDQDGALGACRDLARIAPTLEHKCLLAEHLLATGQKEEAGRVLAQGLDDFRYTTGLSRRRDRKWLGKAKQLTKQAG
ncbi:MAG TPA: tetratricopeptide repeat protein [Gemmataceae bacterium]|nr:tetratricopeptide repeat protein [Gemmataceae bacterium]